MIAIARKNLPCLFLNPNLFFCNSNVPFFLSIHPFSTSKPIIRSTEIYEVLVNKHQFSPESASLASSRLSKLRTPERADSVLSFLKENSFTTAQMEKIVLYRTQILGSTIEDLKFRFKVFHDLGFAPEVIAKIMTSNPSILFLNTKKRIIPSISVLEGLLGSTNEVARLLRKSAWFISSDLEKTFMLNVEILKMSGLPMECICRFLYMQPRFMLIKPDLMRKSVDRAIEFGLSPTSVTFIYAAEAFCCTSEAMWEIKLQNLRDLGFSDDDVFTMFRKTPLAFALSEKKMKNVIELLLATGMYDISDIVTSPASLGSSIEKRLEPRLQILRILENGKLIENWPALSTLCHCTNDKFFERFIRPYYAEIGEEQITKYMSKIQGKQEMKPYKISYT